jgi:hypothetical protein
MELDEIKKNWAEMEALKEKLQISDNKIKEMLKNEGKSALAKLIKVSKFYIISAIPLGLLFCLCSYKFFEAGGYYLILPLLFMLICQHIGGLEIYLYRLLKGIDFSNMSVRDVSEKILKYRNIIQKIQLYGTIGVILFLGTWMFFYYKLFFGSEIVWGFIIYMIVLLVGGVCGLQIFFKKVYYKNIKKIQESLNELKVFEN